MCLGRSSAQLRRHGGYDAALRELVGQKVDTSDENALRTAMVQFFSKKTRNSMSTFSLPLMTWTMPIEDASVVWPEEFSPYRRVAMLVFPPQYAYSKELQQFIDYQMSFSPSHSLSAHRPLGGIMRPRMAVYPAMVKMRRKENLKPMVEPASLAKMPR